MRPLDELGRAVAEAQDEQLERARLVEVTAARLRWPPEARPRRGRWVALAAGVALALAGGAWFARTSAAPVALTSAGVEVGAWAEAPTAVPMSFSDGAEVQVSAGSRFRVAELSPAGAVVSVERGEVRVSVPHRRTTKWAIGAGPFTVHVVGTRFVTGWNPLAQTFTLELQEGAVLVEGPSLREPRRVTVGERIEWSLTPVAPSPTPPAPPRQPEVVAPAERPPAERPGRPNAGQWRALALSNQYRPALTAAQREGWAKLLASAPAGDLVLLADVARLSGEAELAKSAYEKTRARYPGSTSAATAGFFLGRIAFDEGDDATAKACFLRYRREQPRGALAAEALGRLIELLQRARAPEARAAAEEYLKAYPEGPHSRMAKALLEE